MKTPSNDQMLRILQQLTDKGLNKTTALLYLSNLITLNDKLPFKNLSFLRRKERTLSKLDDQAESTRRTYLASIVSVLDLFKDKPSYDKLRNFQQKILAQKVEELNDKPKNIKTEKQQNNWIQKEDVDKILSSLRQDAEELKDRNFLTSAQFNKIINFLVLSLYTDIQPRRNQDYAEMFIVKKYNDSLPKDRNYLSLDDNQFIFNKYKTSKKQGTEVIDFTDNPPIKHALAIYLKHHPLNKGRKTKNWSIPFLVSQDGAKFNNTNAITRVLNRIFKKNIGSSMLRHIQLTHKQGDVVDEMKKDSEAMGHSLSQQKEYILKDNERITE